MLLAPAGVVVPARAPRHALYLGLAALGLGAVGLALLAAAGAPNPSPLPRPDQVRGDLVQHWGATPTHLRPLFLLMEETSRIAGSARMFAIIAHAESRFQPQAHNTRASEREKSAAAYTNNRDRNPPLRYGAAAAAFGSGGLFGALAPYFLWTGFNEVGERAPLLAARPEAVFDPRIAAFAALVYMQRIIAHYDPRDPADVRAGWASPSLLTGGRGGSTYQEVRARFVDDARELGVPLAQLPARFDASDWPGVLPVFNRMVGALPVGMT